MGGAWGHLPLTGITQGHIQSQVAPTWKAQHYKSSAEGISSTQPTKTDRQTDTSMEQPEAHQAKVGSLPGWVLAAPTAMETHGPWTRNRSCCWEGPREAWTALARTAPIWFLNSVFSESFWQMFTGLAFL